MNDRLHLRGIPNEAQYFEVPADVLDRFWPKVDVRGPDECWPWTAYRDRKGYGRLGMDGGNVLAHRVSFALANGGAVEAGVHVLHKCDWPPCVNPAHLFPGDQALNVADRDAKGRTARGEALPHKLTGDDVEEIRRLYESERHLPRQRGGKPNSGRMWTYEGLAEKFDVGKTTIRDIVNGKIWRAA